MSIAELFIKRPAMTTLVMMAILSFGAIGYILRPVSDLPNVDFPTIVVSAGLPGASPKTMSTAVAMPLEREFSTIAGVDSMTSVSSRGSTSITLQFSLNRSIDAAALDVQTMIAKAGHDLPRDLPAPPSLRKVNPADQPVLYLSLSSSALRLSEVDEYAETTLAQQISTINGVAQVDVYGAQKYAVRAQLNPLALAARRIGIDEVTNVIAAERGNSDFDMRHRLSINYTWELPLGRSRTFLADGVMGRILEGFQLSGITSFQTGHPYDVWGTRDSQHTGLSDRARIVGNTSDFSGCSLGGSPLYEGIPGQTLTGVSYCAFANPDYNTASNLGRNPYYGPRYSNFDMSLAKRTSITERVKLETRFELFNIFNHPQFYQPGNTRAAPGTFGVSTSTLTRSDGTTSARQLQVAMKLTF